MSPTILKVLLIVLFLASMTSEYFILKSCNEPTPIGYSVIEVDRLLDSVLLNRDIREAKLKDSIKVLNTRIDTVYINMKERDAKTKKEIQNLPSRSSYELDSLIFLGTEFERVNML